MPRRYSFWDLHVAMQDAIGWMDCHLHQFRLHDPKVGEIVEIGIPDEELLVGEPSCQAGWDVSIAPFFQEPGLEAEYVYDFGDDWVHSVVFEKAVPLVRGRVYPVCLAGERAGPPEDCGGPFGYQQLLETISNPRHQNYRDTLEWLGDSFDPEAFNASTVRFDDPKVRWQTAFRGTGH